VNHFAIFRNVDVEPLTYPYYDPKTIGLDYAGLVHALEGAPDRSVFLLHGCAHNPTGVDPTRAQWEAVADVVLRKGHYAFFDCAYQGFASGDLDADAWAVRYFVQRGVPLLVCQVRWTCAVTGREKKGTHMSLRRALRRTRGCTASAWGRFISSRRQRTRRCG
jgi:aspartate/tyrosine/aromatic aminotransferase